MKNKLVIIITSCLSFLLSSCMDSNEMTDIELVSDCQISSFALSHDSVPVLSKVKFTIDQLTGKIFNIDSLPYGTKIEKVVCSLKTSGKYSVRGIEVTPEAYQDSTYFMEGLSDSVDFSAPVKFVVHAYDGATKKVYNAHINIHQIIPDSMVWTMYGSSVLDIPVMEQKVVVCDYEDKESYFMFVKTTDETKPYRLFYAPVSEPKGWNELALNGLPNEGVSLSQIVGFQNNLYVSTIQGLMYKSENGIDWGLMEDAPKIKTLLGEIKESAKQPSALSAIVDLEGSFAFYAMNELGVWTKGSRVERSFPVRGFASIQYSSMFHEYLMVVGGRTEGSNIVNSTWTTMDGLKWTEMSNGKKSFSKREGASVVAYDDKLLLIGGIDEVNRPLKDLYQSIDFGLTWSLIDTLMTLPPEYEARGFSSVYVDKKNFVNIFGGKTGSNSNDLNQLWRGRLNRLIVKED